MPVRVALLSLLAVLALCGDAGAAYPGRAGLLAVVASEPGTAGADRIDLIRTDGTRVRRIACPRPCSDLWPAWSPNGARLAFNARLSPAPGGMRVAIVRADGSHRLVLPAPAPSVDAVAPAWSLDASRLAFGAVGFDVGAIWTADLRGTVLQRLAAGQEPAWSVRGRIAYTAGGPAQIWSMKADGTDRRRLTRDSGDHHYPDWSPDGRRLAYTRIARGTESIWTITAAGRHPRRLTAGSAPAYSPDGRRIAFERGGRIYVMDASGAHVRRVPYAPRTASGRRVRLGLPDWQPLPPAGGRG